MPSPHRVGPTAGPTGRRSEPHATRERPRRGDSGARTQKGASGRQDGRACERGNRQPERVIPPSGLSARRDAVDGFSTIARTCRPRHSRSSRPRRAHASPTSRRETRQLLPSRVERHGHAGDRGEQPEPDSTPAVHGQRRLAGASQDRRASHPRRRSAPTGSRRRGRSPEGRSAQILSQRHDLRDLFDPTEFALSHVGRSTPDSAR